MEINVTIELYQYIRHTMLTEHVDMKELANRMEVSTSTLYNMFRQENITLNHAAEILDALGYVLDFNIVKKEALTARDDLPHSCPLSKFGILHSR